MFCATLPRSSDWTYNGLVSLHENFGDWLTQGALTESIAVWTDRYLSARFVPGTDTQTATSKSQQAAWDLYIELRTRVATEALPLHSGQEGAALGSLHSLFERSRATFHEHGPETAWLAAIAFQALNEDLRPVTAYWHGVVGDGSFVYPDEAGDFRADLFDLQGKLRLLTDFLGYAARGASYHPLRLARERVTTARRSVAPLPATTTSPLLTELETAENASIARRREYMGLAKGEPKLDRTGVALSGGGIRSATFGLGVLTALSRAGLYHQFDYVSTVSGGGYTGTLLSTWATAKAAEPASDEERRIALKEGPFCDDAATEHLRDRSRYLIEGGFVGVARAVLPISLGILTSIATVLLTTPLALLLLFASERLIAWMWAHATFTLGGAVALTVVALGATRISALKAHAIAAGAKALVGVTVLFAPVITVRAMATARHALGTIAALELPPETVLAALPFVLTGLGTLFQRRAGTQRLALILLAASPWVAYGIGLTWLDLRVLDAPLHVPHLTAQDALDWYAFALIGAVIVFLAADVNEHSPLGYYRDRLAATYCVLTMGKTLRPDPRPPALEDLTDLAPIHLVNATVNVPASRARNDRGRGATIVTFSRHGWTYPREHQGRIEHQHTTDPPLALDTDLAMAVSGAAVSPWMGTLTPGGASPWLTLFNLRLNAWLPNPGQSPSAPWGYYLLRELLGLVGLNGSRLNVSDGGHFENLGVYALLRRRCRYIVAIDGEADPELGCGGLMNLIRLARVDFGADVRIDPRKFSLNTERYSRAHLAIGKIRYVDGQEGTLLYVKLSVTGDEPAHLLAYRVRESAFPHHSTADQVFDEEQFESYRALGQHVGEYLFRTELVGALAARAYSPANGSNEKAIGLGEWLNAIEAALNRST